MMAHVWPGSLAMDQAISVAARALPGGMALLGGHFTQDNFLPEVVRHLTGEPKLRPLSDLAGALLIQRLLGSESGGAEVFQGLRRGWRLPVRLWRLLVEIRAGGLEDWHLLDIGGQRCQALAELLNAYERALNDLGLMDQADGIRLLERQERDISLPWSGLVFHDVLWLRSLDMRLIRVLCRVIPAEVQFSLPPQGSSASGLARLQRASADYLEATSGGSLTIKWRYAPEGEPIADLVGALLSPGSAPLAFVPHNLELAKAAGRYGEAELLLDRAAELIEAGAAPHQIALVFPDLDIYGQMVADAAGRRRLPVNISSGGKASAVPLTSDLSDLLALPAGGYARRDLADVLDSPMVGKALAQMLGQAPARGADYLLASAGYIDGKETMPGPYLQGFGASGGGMYEGLAALCLALQNRLAVFGRDATIAQYAADVSALVEDLGLESFIVKSGGRPEVQVAEIKALDLLRRTCRDLALAAETAGWFEPLSQGRLLSLLKQCLDSQSAPAKRGHGGGIQVLRMDQATGGRFNYLLVGGLAQGEFPRKAQAAHLLSSEERLALGKRAGMPIWRTDDEEYGGQMMRLAGLLYEADSLALLCCPGADSGGSELEPSNVFREVVRLTGIEPQKGGGGVFGAAPDLDKCNDIDALFVSLAASNGELGQAVAHWLAKDERLALRWREVCQKVATETCRNNLDMLLGESRFQAADSFAGNISSADASGLLRSLLDDPRRRGVSPSSLEAYSGCPMYWFFNRIIGVKALDEPDWAVSGSQEGELVHNILADFFAPEEFDPTWDAQSREARLSNCLDKHFNRQGPGHPFVRLARRLALIKYLTAVIEQQWPLLVDGGMRPIAVEQEIKGLEVPVDGGEPLAIVGRLDRLDADQAGGQDLLRVIDYKHSNDKNSFRKMANTNLWLTNFFQLAAYMAATARASQGQAKIIQGQIVATRKPQSSPKEVVLAADDPLINDDLIQAVANLWREISAGKFVAAPSTEACEYCDFSGICRAKLNPAAVEEGGES